MKIKLDLLPEEARELLEWVRQAKTCTDSQVGTFSHRSRAILHLEGRLAHNLALHVERKTEPAAPRRPGLAP